MKFNKIAFIASNSKEAQKALKELSKKYNNSNVDQADIIVALGGDGLLLNVIETYGIKKIPIYGMNRGTIGFLMNTYSKENLIERINNAVLTKISPLVMEAQDIYEKKYKGIAINEVSLLRQSRMTAKIIINVNNKKRLNELVCDGVMLATPAGSTAYNLSANGPILPINSKLLSLTSICAFRPRRWRGALLPKTSSVDFIVKDPKTRGVSATAGNLEVRNVKSVNIKLSTKLSFKLLFDTESSLEEKFINEQFSS
ncbi:MAG: NAD kinase [Alphaproteobacteria bacterium]|tara:strand:- start:66 stop:833 length:768 start_codon:yes stop_codon:yes gene_type:complete